AFGLGKTGLLIAVVNACIDSGIPAFYNNAPRMLDELRAGYRNDTYDDKMNQLIQAPVLAIDEFHRVYDKGGGGNAEGSSSWAAEHIFTIVDERYTFADERMTLIATNRNPTSGDDPISSRFSDKKRCHIVPLTGKDMRKHAVLIQDLA
ncbi:partial Primosomal protein DnaI, partial [Anaerolineae bacterium]